MFQLFLIADPTQNVPDYDPNIIYIIIYIYIHIHTYQDPPMIHLFVYRFFSARAGDFRLFPKNLLVCKENVRRVSLPAGFATVFEFAVFCILCGNLCFFAHLFARIKANK